MKLLIIILLTVVTNAFAQEDIVKYKSNEVCQYLHKVEKWGEWEQKSTLFTVLKKEERIKIHNDGNVVVYDILDYKEKTEIIKGQESVYYEMKVEDQNGDEAAITFGDSGHGLVFIVHSGLNYSTINCYAVTALD